VLAGIVLLVVAANRGGGGGSSTAATSSSAPAPGQEPEDPDAAVSTTPPSPHTEQPAPSVISREGVPAASRTVSAAPAGFSAPASWSDGTSIRVTAAHQQTTTGTGPGQLAGQPQTVFRLELRNGSRAPLDLNSVVVQATYGSPPVQASPLYDEQAVDFGGTADPGAVADAVYSFAIPADQLGDVVLSVDVDGYHFPATFSGAVPTR
jgi:hypothetical protein